MITQNSVSYDQQELQAQLTKFISDKEIDIKYVTEFGSAKLTTSPQSNNTEWDKIKDDIIFEYDDLWQELAKS